MRVVGWMRLKIGVGVLECSNSRYQVTLAMLLSTATFLTEIRHAVVG